MQSLSYLIRNYEKSIVRSSISILCFLLPGFFVNYMRYVEVSKIISPNDFSIFYTAIIVVNILSSPAYLINFYYTRQIAKTRFKFNIQQAITDFRWYFWRIMKWSSLGAIILVIVLIAIAELLGLKSYLLMIFISCCVLGNYLMEAVRTGIQSLRRFNLFGILTFIWVILSFILCVAGIYLFGIVWVGIAGIAISSVPVIILTYLIINRNTDYNRNDYNSIESSYFNFFIFIGSFGFTGVILNLDIVLAYFCLSEVDLSIYTASAVLPKGILLASLPIIRILLPNVIDDNHVNQTSIINLIKSMILTFLLLSTGAVLLIFANDLFLNHKISIESANSYLIATMLISSVPLGMIRVLVSYELALDNDWHPLLLLVPVIIYVLFLFFNRLAIVEFARSYLIFSLVTFIYYFIICFKNYNKEFVHLRKQLKI